MSSIDAALDMWISCPGPLPSLHTARQPGYEGDAFLKLKAASTAEAGFPESRREVLL